MIVLNVICGLLAIGMLVFIAGTLVVMMADIIRLDPLGVATSVGIALVFVGTIWGVIVLFHYAGIESSSLLEDV